LQVKRDGVTVGEGQWGSAIPVERGEHTLEASAPGRRTWTSTIAVTGPGTTTIEVPSLAEGPTNADIGAPSLWSARRIAGVTVGLGGVVGLAVGSVFGVLAISKKNDSNANEHCDASDACDSIGKSLRADSIHAGNVSTGLFVAGGVLVAGGIVLMVTAPSGGKGPDAGRPAAALAFGPGSLSLRGRW
jgi:hypothetical protein